MERIILRHLHHAPALALELFPTLPCPETRRRLTPLIANEWKLQEINWTN